MSHYLTTTKTNGNVNIMYNILVTGGLGFIGSHLVCRLLEDGHFVQILDNLSTGSLNNLRSIKNRTRLRFIYGDICNIRTCEESCENIDYVFHQAAIPSVPKSVEQPHLSHDTNINGTFNMLQAANLCGVKRFIYAGSSSAYGDTKESPKHERLRPMPLSPYAVQKYTGECYCRAFFECYGLETVSLRYFNVFGERQDPKSQYAAAIPAFVTSLLQQQTPTIYGDGEQTRDFTYIENVVHGNILAMQVEKTHGEAVNVACGNKITVNSVIDTICNILQVRRIATYTEKRLGDIRHSCADITLAESFLKYKPVVGFGTGMRRSIGYYKENANVR